eukprot:TRINITY_DN52794_c0_g1_i1.p1 TRINITY_DN52794_c0_g1~~TRINITY_DN52794_c0_g1_i1.p1  ORF type:complete len:450 (-),score=95.20 TRINITY_DN52794_c0_g1_i1:75-1424(-)
MQHPAAGAEVSRKRCCLYISLTLSAVAVCWMASEALRAGKTVLVLAGGGAKGAWAVGALKGICEKSELRNSWYLISGTSIGALNAGLLAQFPPDRQCTDGISAMEGYWRNVKSANDVWKTTPVPGRWDGFGATKPCLDPSNILAAGYGFYSHGGFCDPAPGTENYYRAVNASNIRRSGTKLKVTAASLLTGEPKVFTQDSPEIVDGCMASGSIAPVVYPKHIGDDIYVDGGIYHNTPLLGTLDNSVKRAIVVELSPLDALPKVAARQGKAGSGGTDAAGKKNGVSGFEVLDYYLQALYIAVADRREIRDACEFYPHVEILAVVPSEPVGSLLDFYPEAIDKMMADGLRFVRDGHGPVDVCAVLGLSPTHRMMLRVFGRDPLPAWLSGLTPGAASSTAFAGGIGSGRADASGFSTLAVLAISLVAFFLGRGSARQQPVAFTQRKAKAASA